MDLRYDIYERFADGGFLWRAAATGVQSVQEKLAQLATTSHHEFFAVHLLTQETVARVNVSAAPQN